MLTLKKNYEFQKVFKKGKWYSSEYLTIYVEPNNKNINRIGIAVGRKVAKSTKRNRIRRLIRETYRLNENNIKKGFNIIIVWKTSSGFRELKQKDVELDLIGCFIKAELIEK